MLYEKTHFARGSAPLKVSAFRNGMDTASRKEKIAHLTVHYGQSDPQTYSAAHVTSIDVHPTISLRKMPPEKEDKPYSLLRAINFR